MSITHAALRVFLARRERAARGLGDHAEQRHALIGRPSVDELLARMKARRPKATRKRR